IPELELAQRLGVFLAAEKRGPRRITSAALVDGLALGGPSRRRAQRRQAGRRGHGHRQRQGQGQHGRKAGARLSPCSRHRLTTRKPDPRALTPSWRPSWVVPPAPPALPPTVPPVGASQPVTCVTGRVIVGETAPA